MKATAGIMTKELVTEHVVFDFNYGKPVLDADGTAIGKMGDVTVQVLWRELDSADLVSPISVTLISENHKIGRPREGW